MSDSPADVRFDHTIVPARDKYRSARFFAGVFGLPDPVEAGFFLQVRLSDGRILDFAEPGVEFPGQHFAFLVDDPTFDAVLARIQRDGITHWADPAQRLPGEINTNHGGRGVYFDDPAGHHLEALTARYDGTDLT
ncbi:MAG: VOC family protein [Streptosporangiales bacterium]|nr:VOC family protein [Streptosporangiales bacterium]